MDGDDWFNVRLVDEVMKLDCDLIYINKGVVVDFKNFTYFKKFGVCRYCGSTFIYRFETVSNILASEEINQGSLSSDNAGNESYLFFLKNILGNHRHQLEFFFRKNLKIVELPIWGICYVLVTRQNHSRVVLNRGLIIDRLTLVDFGVDSVLHDLNVEKDSQF